LSARKGKLIDPMNTRGLIVYFYDLTGWRMPAVNPTVHWSGRTVFPDLARNRGKLEKTDATGLG
jgi:hypothetical protein